MLAREPGQVERLQPQTHGPASQALRPLQARPWTLLEVFFATPPDIVRVNPVSLRFIMFAEFTSEPVQAFDRHIHQPLGVGNLFLQALGVDRSLLFQRQQSDI